MAVALEAPEHLSPIVGVRLGTAEAAIKKPGRPDLLVLELAPGTTLAGVFTRNAFAAAPVRLCRERLAQGAAIRALVVNAGNANAATGEGGLADARAVCSAVADGLGCEATQVLPFSTGVIGQRLPVERMLASVPAALLDLQPEHWPQAMRAIMTTDTVPKGASRTLIIDGRPITVTGIAKGVGMIHPDMATLLAFVGTDAPLSASATRIALSEAVDQSFNCATVDGDTSTNDSCVLFATGKAGGPTIDSHQPAFAELMGALREVFVTLAQAVVRDGEGATKFITIVVEGALDAPEARQVALSVAHSPLVKTALFASDANWGRIAMAIGKAGVESLDVRGVSIALDTVPVIEAGEPHPDYHEALGAAVVAKTEFTIRIGLSRGLARTTIWTCDFSYDYVRINAEYRT